MKRCLRVLCGGKDDQSDDGPTRTGQTSALHACVSIIKCVIGAGSFFLPYGIKKAGLWGGVVGLLCLGALCDYIDYRIIQCKRKLFGGRTVSYPDLAEATFGIWVRRFSYVFLLIQGLGACAVYAVFCGDLLHAVVHQVSVVEWVLIIGGVEVLLSLFKTLAYVGVTSLLGDAALVLGVVVVFVYGFDHDGFIDSPFAMPVIRIDTYPQFFGTAAFLFSITMYLFPIESAMREPKRFNVSMHIAFIITTIGNVIFASFAYMFFGDEVKEVVIDNLGASAYVTLAKVALVLDLVFTFVVVFIPCRSVVEESLLGRYGLLHWLRQGRLGPPASPSSSSSSSSSQSFASQKRLPITTSDGEGSTYPAETGTSTSVGSINNLSDHPDNIIDEQQQDENEDAVKVEKDLVPHWERAAVRTAMIAATIGLACAIPNVIDLVGLVAGVSNSMNSFILPTLIYMRVHYCEHNQGFVSIYDLKEKRKENRRMKRKQKKRGETKADHNKDVDTGTSENTVNERRSLLLVHGEKLGDLNSDMSSSEAIEIEGAPMTPERSEGSTIWQQWKWQVEQGRKGSPRGVWYWVQEIVHWTVHLLIVVFGTAMGALTTVQAFQTVLSDYT